MTRLLNLTVLKLQRTARAPALLTAPDLEVLSHPPESCYPKSGVTPTEAVKMPDRDESISTGTCKRRRPAPAQVTGRFAARAALAVAVLLAIGLAACGGKDSRSADKSNNSGDSSSALTGGNDIDGKKVLFLEPNNAGNVFDKPVMKAVDAAEALTGLDVNFQFADTNMAKLRDMVKTGIAQNVGGIIVSIPDGSLNEAICDAREAGIPVIAWNVNGTTGRGRDCVMAFIGQSFVTSGEVIGNRMIEEGVIKQGDEVFCPVEFPESSYAAERAAGVNNALEKMGTKCSVVGTTADLSRARTTMVQYLLGHRNTKAIISLGGTPNSVAEAAVKQARIGEVALGGFDLTPEIIESVQNGSMIATVDQQPYSQGFFSVMQMALLLKYGLYPSDMATGGRGLVDKSNVDLVASLVPDYR